MTVFSEVEKATAGLTEKLLREALNEVYGIALPINQPPEVIEKIRTALALTKTQAEKEAGALLGYRKANSKLQDLNSEYMRLISVGEMTPDKMDSMLKEIKKATWETHAADKACLEAGLK